MARRRRRRTGGGGLRGFRCGAVLVTLVEANKDYGRPSRTARIRSTRIDEKAKEKNGNEAARVRRDLQKGKVLIIRQREGSIAQTLDVMDKAKPNLTAMRSSRRWARILLGLVLGSGAQAGSAGK